RRLEDHYDRSAPGPCMHECVVSALRQKKLGITAMDIAKRLLDLGFYAPSTYFPLIVEEALMIEPTATESKETLDEFCDAMIQIAREARTTPHNLLAPPAPGAPDPALLRVGSAHRLAGLRPAPRRPHRPRRGARAGHRSREASDGGQRHPPRGSRPRDHLQRGRLRGRLRGRG